MVDFRPGPAPPVMTNLRSRPVMTVAQGRRIWLGIPFFGYGKNWDARQTAVTLHNVTDATADRFLIIPTAFNNGRDGPAKKPI